MSTAATTQGAEDNDFRCRRGVRCSDRVPDPEAPGGWLGCPIMAVTGLCRICGAQAKDAVRKLTLDYVELNTHLAADGSNSGEAPVSGSREMPIPIRTSIEALQAEIVRETAWWASAVVAALRVDAPLLPTAQARRVQRATDIVIAAWTTLLDLPTQVHHVHDDGRDYWFERDGLDAALVFLDLHDRTAFITGRAERVTYLPARCPDCGTLALIRRNGVETVECRRCKRTMTAAEYDAHKNRLALDLRGLGEIA